MAYDQHWRPDSQNSMSGLCSSHPYLDGIPFKISSAVRPQAQPVLPPELLQASSPCQVLQEEYSFEMEDAVLAWSRAREEAMARALAEREAAEQARAALAAAEAAAQENGADHDDKDDNHPPSASAGNGVQRSEGEVSRVKPTAASLSGSMLTPTPIQTSQAKVQSPLAPRAAVDLALFEKEDDPFDNMELQTLNDMEELRTVLTGTAVEPGPHGGPSPNPDDQTSRTANGGEGAGQGGVNGNPLTTNIFSHIPGVKPMESTQPSHSIFNNHSAGADNVSKVDHPFGSSSASTAGVESTGSWVQFDRDGDSTPKSEGAEFSPPPHLVNSKVVNSVLPPLIRPRGKSVGGEGAADTSGTVLGSSPVSSAGTHSPTVAYSSVPQPPRGQGSGGECGMSRSAYAMSTPASGAVRVPVSDVYSVPPSAQHAVFPPFPGARPACTAASTTAAVAVAGSVYSRYGNLPGSGSPVPMNGWAGGERGGGALRNAKSSPDLSARSPSPYGGRPTSSSAQQSWNHYAPLPPTPVPGGRGSNSPSPESAAAECLRTCSPHLPPSSSAPLQPDYDPYPLLCSESKTFVNNLTSMGFSRARVSRAVDKFGPDEREVLDHLLNVDRLVERRVSPALAETSLHLFKNDMHKAELFLDLYRQFQELGFTGERIQTALVRHQLDRDKALDYLTT